MLRKESREATRNRDAADIEEGTQIAQCSEEVSTLPSFQETLPISSDPHVAVDVQELFWDSGKYPDGLLGELQEDWRAKCQMLRSGDTKVSAQRPST
ncbi:hypothetical protein AK812_SmicGene48046, partial [Symbiodinium microadriaticum]